MKIATFNINNINKRLANLLHWLELAEPDVVCLQELKAEQDAFPLEAIADAMVQQRDDKRHAKKMVMVNPACPWR